MAATCFNCGHPIEDICADDVRAAVGEEGVPLSVIAALPNGTLAKRSKIVRGMILDGELVLTAQRTLHLPGTL